MVLIGSPWRTNCHNMEHIENLCIERLWEQDNKFSVDFLLYFADICVRNVTYVSPFWDDGQDVASVRQCSYQTYPR